MAKQYQLYVLNAGVKLWNQLRQESIIKNDLIQDNEENFYEIDLSEADLCGRDLNGVDFHESNLRRTYFNKADLSYANLISANLDNAYFTETKLMNAKLSLSKLYNADFEGANLENADLSLARLNGANLSKTTLNNTDFYGAYLQGANLCGADLSKADLFGAHLDEANLEGANLSEKDLSKNTLRGANLRNADLSKANLSGVDLSFANLTGADLSETNLSGSNLAYSTFADTNLIGSNLVNCNIFGLSAWNIKTDTNTKQHNLIITRNDEPRITVDNIEIAQFIYLLINAKKTLSVIDTIRLKVVLIIGRFTVERKQILDTLREELRMYNNIPVLFDFDRPSNRNTRETLERLAGVSKYIIADITDPESIPMEFVSTVSQLPNVPVLPILLEGHEPWELYKSIQSCDWVHKLISCDSIESIIDNIPKIVANLEKAHLEGK